MVDLKLLEERGVTQTRLREVFTAKKGSADYAIRERMQDLVQSRIHEGIYHSCRNHSLYLAVDLAWDSLPINKFTIPLLQYAQGKINIKTCAEKLEDIDPNLKDQFVEYDEENNIRDISLTRIYEVSVSLIRSYITRRVAAQVSRFSNLYPYFKYAPRGTDMPSKIRAEVLSQRVEIMCEQFDYRHTFAQAIRNMFMYGFTVLFPAEAWTREVHWRKTKNAIGEDDMESYVEREGVYFVNPHPTRCIYDNARPLQSINSDLGPSWIGYWDIVRYGSVRENPEYWNMDEITYTNSLQGIVNAYRDFFDFYYDPKILAFPTMKDDFPFQNERVSHTGIYAGEDQDKGMFLSTMFMKVNPKAEGLGDYPFDCWLKLVVASDETVVYAEWLPSLPAIYGGINQNDDRMANCSMAHDLMPYQDQMNNIIYAMLHHMKVSMFKILTIDQDALDDDVREYLVDSLAEDTFYQKPKAMFYSGAKAADLGIDTKNIINVVDVSRELSQGISQSLQSLFQLLNLVERLMILSPQELGQAAQREISATEVSEITNSTNTIYAFISEGIDEMRAAAKKMLYEHLISCSTTDFNVPVKQRFTPQSIREAGLEIEDTGDQDEMPKGRNIIGSPQNLVHEYLFSARDGSERQRDTQSAQILGQLVQQVLTIPDMAQTLGKERIFSIFNEIFRMSGVGHDLNLEVDEADDNEDMELGQTQFIDDLRKKWPQVEQFLQQLMMQMQNAQGQPNPQQPQQQPQQQAQQQPTPVA
tara:strand:+ start:1211 stop:3475 length:2265 start_codon:yes stop_codon:yes gene_type:complete